MSTTIDAILRGNDIFSYRKDLPGVDCNLISILGDKGSSAQQSMERLGVMVNDCYRLWYTELAELPQCGKEMDREALKFVDLCSLIPLANLYRGSKRCPKPRDSYKTGRYLGAEGHEVHKTKVLYLHH
ncbi:hypothetical protein RRF57_011212 [Xylaria bambusicola]|uniref:Uncharacterized protein n=1 Tax=Xylaria bambusicola TaxID=326684 RepID=A0AAN7UMG3_9PEZI